MENFGKEKIFNCVHAQYITADLWKTTFEKTL